MAAPDQQGNEQEIAKLFQNVGQGLQLVAQYVANVAPDAQPMAEQLLQGYGQLVEVVVQARQGGAAPRQEGPMPQEAGVARTRQAF